MCEFCGCGIGRSSMRRGAQANRKEKTVGVRIVAVAKEPKVHQAVDPTEATRALIERAHARYPDQVEARAGV